MPVTGKRGRRTHERRTWMMNRPYRLWKRCAGLLAAAAALALAQGPAAHAEPFRLGTWIGLRPNLQISSSLSAPYEHPVTHAQVRHLSFVLFNAGPVACGANTTMLQIEVGDPG